jgi:hypothetical protein
MFVSSYLLAFLVDGREPSGNLSDNVTHSTVCAVSCSVTECFGGKEMKIRKNKGKEEMERNFTKGRTDEKNKKEVREKGGRDIKYGRDKGRQKEGER